MEIAGSCFTPWCEEKGNSPLSPSVAAGMPVLTWAMRVGHVNLNNMESTRILLLYSQLLCVASLWRLTRRRFPPPPLKQTQRNPLHPLTQREVLRWAWKTCSSLTPARGQRRPCSLRLHC